MGSSTTIANQYVREVMTRHVRTIAQTATIYEASQLMKELGVGAVPVCHGRRLEGIPTDRDIIIRVIAEERNPAETRVADVMTTDVTYCYENQTVDAAVRVMAGSQIRRLPIVTPEMELVGLVSLGDVAVRSDEPMAAGIALEGASKPPRTEPLSSLSGPHTAFFCCEPARIHGNRSVVQKNSLGWSYHRVSS